jgi:hypothetical protein
MTISEENSSFKTPHNTQHVEVHNKTTRHIHTFFTKQSDVVLHPGHVIEEARHKQRCLILVDEVQSLATLEAHTDCHLSITSTHAVGDVLNAVEIIRAAMHQIAKTNRDKSKCDQM